MRKILAVAVLSLVTVAQFAHAKETNQEQLDPNDIYAHAFSAPGTRNVRTVLLDKLYRGGGPGGSVSLETAGKSSNDKDAYLRNLCEQGFSDAIYLYPKNMSEHKVSCSKGSITYSGGGFRDDKGRRKSLEIIHNAIRNNSGKVFIHCWNGLHASGEIAAVSLMQFCDWSGDQAADYWEKLAGHPLKGVSWEALKNHIRTFRPYGDLRLNQQEQQKLCPSPN